MMKSPSDAAEYVATVAFLRFLILLVFLSWLLTIGEPDLIDALVQRIGG